MFIAQADFAVMGADVIYNNSFLNKTGLFSVALAARYYNKPVYVLSDSRKLEETNIIPDLETAHEGDLLWKNPPKGITTVNVYFESVPRKLITAIYLETGVMI